MGEGSIFCNFWVLGGNFGFGEFQIFGGKAKIGYGLIEYFGGEGGGRKFGLLGNWTSAVSREAGGFG